MVGCETAAHLAEKGKEVVVVECRSCDFSTEGGLAPDMEPDLRRWFLFELWPSLPIEVASNSTLTEVTESGVIVTDREERQRAIEGDTIVLAMGMRSNNELKARLQGKAWEIHEVGDCVEPRKIVNAIHEASQVARLI